MPLQTVDDCRVLELPKIPDFRGSLSFVESSRHVPFRIQRAYWVYDVPGDAMRVGHAYRALEEVVISLSGSFEVRLDDGRSTRTVRLSRSYLALHITPMVWRNFADFSTNSVCLVLASGPYDEADYVRDYDEYVRLRSARA